MTHVSKRPCRALACAAALSGGLLALPAWAADLRVEVNHSHLHTLKHAASTLIVGNPAIADVSISNNNTLVVFGKTYGMTNLIALDATGRQVANLDVRVTESGGTNMVVNRGASQLSYSCAPRCVRVIDTADEPTLTDSLISTTKSVTGYADAAASGDTE